MRTLVAVAHSDDESLWCHDFITLNPGTHVAVCSIDRRSGKEHRVECFYRACESMGAVAFIVAGKFDLWGIDTRPIQAFAAQYDRIVTHNALGEYGHPAHIKLHHAMLALKKPMQVFGYGLIRGDHVADYNKKLATIALYEDDRLLPWISKKFNLAYEGLVTAYTPPFRYRHVVRITRRLHPRPSARRIELPRSLQNSR